MTHPLLNPDAAKPKIRMIVPTPRFAAGAVLVVESTKAEAIHRGDDAAISAGYARELVKQRRAEWVSPPEGGK